MNLDRTDRELLERLRACFLSGHAGETPYWESERMLMLYHETFAQRIAWKWHAVLDELDQRGWHPAPGVTLVDVGCGTGIATEIMLERYGTDHLSTVIVNDRSQCAAAFTARRLGELFPSLLVKPTTDLTVPPGSIVVISHVLTEMTTDDIKHLCQHLVAARAVLVVEPGTRHASTRVVMLHEQLRQHMTVVAPCPHQQQCGMTQPTNHLHWCHFHVRPPTAAFTSRQWARFADTFGIDIGDLAVSFMVLDTMWNQPSPAPGRLIGAPDISAHDAVVIVCSSEGIQRRIVNKRHDAELYRRLRKRPPQWIEPDPSQQHTHRSS
ncbi:MAG: small ribosomal subunit Rsm22 family protein [Chlorobi bacterium]|nr:small ribosomal subunit Rsm22 family protein [Chlorobiota bacterium]